jgi:hypothetical protein
MSFYDVASHWLIYVMVIIGIVYVAGFCILSMRKSWKRALAKGYSRERLMTVVKTTVSATVVPSLAVVIGFFTLTTILGVPWPWWRLSVVGSVTYETMAADMAISASGLSLARLSEATAREFVLVMYVMSIGIIGGLILSLFVSKKIQLGTMNITVKDVRWGALGNSIFFLVIVAVFVLPAFIDYTHTGIVRLLTLITSAAVGILLETLAKKCNAAWLKMFTLALSMVTAMASSVLWDKLLILGGI